VGTQITNINAIVELERIGYSFDLAGEEEIRLRCPAHDDETPSVHLNIKKNLWICHAAGCGGKGDVVNLLALILNVERGTMLADLGTRWDIEDVKIINPINVEKMHESIWDAGPLLQELRNRGVTDDMIREARIGLFKNRITIPVYDANRNIVNIRRYLPGAPGPQKMKNTKGYGAARIYQIEQLKYDTVWICGGELKALVAKSILNPNNIGAIAVTAGEGSWEPKWNDKLKDKDVYICMDVDQAGRNAAKNLATIICNLAKNVRIVSLPLDKNIYPKGDINDWVAGEGATLEDFVKVMNEAREFSAKARTIQTLGEPTEVSLNEVTRAENVRRRLQFRGVIAAMDNNAQYLIPRTVGVSCDRQQKYCAVCPINAMDEDPDEGFVKVEIPPVSESLLDMCDAPKKHLQIAIADALDIPPCKSVQFAVENTYKAIEVIINPEISIEAEATSNVTQMGILTQDNNSVDFNVPYDFTGVVYPHPRTQRASLVIDAAVEAEDNLSTFAPTDRELEALKIFRPSEWTADGVESKLRALYDDWAYNVTHVFHRFEIHLLHDLTYLSVLLFEFENKPVSGWVNSIIIGDSSQGKSAVSARLIDFLHLGKRLDCSNATIAGLLGGVQQIANKWFTKWGAIPTHDRRMIVLEELKNAPVEVITKLTDMRSSGVAEIPKIEHRRAHARTRLLVNSNPRNSKAVADHNFGIETLLALIGSLEDIRRFDIACIVSNQQISASDISRPLNERKMIEALHTAELCRRLVLYAWTRRLQEIVFDDDALQSIYDHSVSLTGSFSEAIPLIDQGTIRLKLARLAIATAIRTFSTTHNLRVVKVLQCHVDFVARWLRALYSDPYCGYLDFSKAFQSSDCVKDEHEVVTCIRKTNHPNELIRSLLRAPDVSLADVQDWCDLDRESAQHVLSVFVRKNCVRRNGQNYAKTSSFIDLLKRLSKTSLVTLEPEGRF